VTGKTNAAVVKFEPDHGLRQQRSLHLHRGPPVHDLSWPFQDL
jgi:hypothetical protein